MLTKIDLNDRYFLSFFLFTYADFLEHSDAYDDLYFDYATEYLVEQSVYLESGSYYTEVQLDVFRFSLKKFYEIFHQVRSASDEFFHYFLLDVCRRLFEGEEVVFDV